MAAANDTRFGDEEDGVLAGGLGNDSLSGGTGSAFVFTVSAGTDTIDLSMLPEVARSPTFAALAVRSADIQPDPMLRERVRGSTAAQRYRELAD